MHVLHGTAMGTRWSTKLVAPPSIQLDKLQRVIEKTLDRLISEMSNWIPSSNITAFNMAEAGSWHVLPDDFFHVLQYALAVARETNGAYDPTVAPLVALWGFGPDALRRRLPSDPEIAAARSSCGWSRITLDPQRKSARQPGGVHLDLSSVAKGFAVDQLADVLRLAGFDSFLVEIGGELRGRGVKPDGLPWWVEVEQPLTDEPNRAGSGPGIVVALTGLSIATSGSAVHTYDIDGRRISHTVDPRTGRPIEQGIVSVTVLHSECMRADALSTAITVLGPDEGMKLAVRLGLAARLVTFGPRGLSEAITPKLAAMLA